MAHGDSREGKWRWNGRMEWVASTIHTTSEFGVSSITTADVHTSAASSGLNWRPRRFKWTRHFAERQILVSVRVPSYFKRSLQQFLSAVHDRYSNSCGVTVGYRTAWDCCNSLNWNGNGEDYLTWSFMICNHQIFFGWSNQEKWDGWDMWHVWETEVGHEELWWGNLKERDHWKNQA